MTTYVSIDVAQPPVNNKLPVDIDDAIFKAAAKYRAWGCRILPFQRGAGKCYLTKEAESNFTVGENEIEEKFAGQDVGINVGDSGLVDVDIDCPEAALFTDWLLPKTATIGREGKAVSHLLFRCPEIPSTHFHDLDGEEIVAVLTKNRLLLPPSIHGKANSPLVWTDDVEPAQADAGIVKTVGEIAALSLISRHWPGPHARHDATLALAGMLARVHWPLVKALHAVTLIAKITNDANVADRLVEVESSYDRHAKGEDTTGLPTLAKLLGKTSAETLGMEDKVRLWLASTDSPQPSVQTGPLSKYALPLTELLSLAEPETEYLVTPFLPKPCLAMVFATRGVGKTWFILHLALCLARGVDFLAWAVPKPRRVLLIDGEMPSGYLKYRLKALIGDATVPDNLRVISVERMWRENESLTINRPADQTRIEQCLNEFAAQGWRPDLIIFDNLSALTVGVDENSNSEMDATNPWQIKLRSLGYTVLCVHHAGKNGTQRGASRREDLLDTSIELVEQEGLDLSKPDGACFEIRFSKLRGERPHPDKLGVALEKNETGGVVWRIGTGQAIPAYLNVLRAIRDHKPYSQVALVTTLGITKQAISKHITTARDKGFLKPGGLDLTDSGNAELKKWFAEEDALSAKL